MTQLPSPQAETEPRRRAVLVEDDEAVRRSLQLVLHARGYDVRSFASAAPLLDGFQADGIDLLVTDYRLQDGDGLGVLRALRRGGWQGRAVLITAFPSATLVDSALACGFDAVLEKPLRPNELIGALTG